MAETALAPESAFRDMLPASAAPDGVPPGVTVSERTDLQLATVIARAGPRAMLADRFRATCGIALPEGPTRVAGGRVGALGVGPRTWLVMSAGEASGFAERLSREFGSLAAVSDQSDGYAVLRIAGPAARAVLAKGLGIDLHPRAFDPSRVAASVCSHIGVTIWQTDGTPTFEIALPRSYAGSFAHWLGVSAAEFGCRADAAA